MGSALPELRQQVPTVAHGPLSFRGAPSEGCAKVRLAPSCAPLLGRGVTNRYQAHPKDPRNQPPALGNRGGWRLQPREVPRRCCWRAALAPEAGEQVQDGSPHAPNQLGAQASHPSWS
jgi:hypothetical protein